MQLLAVRQGILYGSDSSQRRGNIQSIGDNHVAKVFIPVQIENGQPVDVEDSQVSRQCQIDGLMVVASNGVQTKRKKEDIGIK